MLSINILIMVSTSKNLERAVLLLMHLFQDKSGIALQKLPTNLTDFTKTNFNTNGVCFLAFFLPRICSVLLGIGVPSISAMQGHCLRETTRKRRIFLDAFYQCLFYCFSAWSDLKFHSSLLWVPARMFAWVRHRFWRTVWYRTNKLQVINYGKNYWQAYLLVPPGNTEYKILPFLKALQLSLTHPSNTHPSGKVPSSRTWGMESKRPAKGCWVGAGMHSSTLKC